MIARILRDEVTRALAAMPSDYFDAAFFDPPYGLEFLGEEWDAPWRDTDGFRRSKNAADAGRDSVFGRMSRRAPEYKAGIGYQEWAATWGAELHRVLKPNAFALSFGGTRTFHRLACGLEDAGFVVRDCISWIYASGMPHSKDIAAGIDERFGAERPIIGSRVLTGNAALSTKEKGGTYGVGAPSAGSVRVDVKGYATPEAKLFKGHGTTLKPAWEPCLVLFKPGGMTFAQAALELGIAALDIDACRIGIDEEERSEIDSRSGAGRSRMFPGKGRDEGERFTSNPLGRWPANVALSHARDCVHVGTRRGVDVVACVEGCPVRELDRQSGRRKGMSGGGKHKAGYRGGMFGGQDSTATARGDDGGASRFFFCSKASKADRHSGGEIPNAHPTVKPTELTRELARLILPPAGRPQGARRLIVPFAGSGSEIIGAARAGWDEITGIERGGWFSAVARCRIEAELEELERERDPFEGAA